MNAPADRALTPPPSTAIDFSATAAVPLGRLTEVELRKLVDTRSGRWLLITQALLIVVASAIVVVVVAVQDEPIALMDFIGIAGTVMGLLLPIMGITAVTSEWSQRTSITTFTLEPRRGRIIGAKMLAAVAIALVWVLIATVVGLIASIAAGAAGVDVDRAADLEGLAGFTLVQVLVLLTGFALGTLLLNTPAAIVCYFAYISIVPVLLAVAADGIGLFTDIRPWLDFNDAQLPLITDDPNHTGFGAVHWGQFTTAGAIWLALPLTLGITRTLHSEIK